MPTGREEIRMIVRIGDNYIDDEIVLGQLFAEYLNYKGRRLEGEADLRCAIKAYSHYVLNTLVDRYGIGERESEI